VSAFVATLQVVAFVLAFTMTGSARADDLSLTLGAAKSAQLSGLFEHILPLFQAASNLTVRPVAVDAGQATAMAQRGDINALLLDDRGLEQKIAGAGYGLDGRGAMYDDFVIVGPKADPAAIHGMRDAAKALAQIAAKNALFAGSGDDSGSYALELRLWKSAGVAPRKNLGAEGSPGRGMAAILSGAAAVNAYALTGRAAWARFKDRQNLEIMVEGDPALFNVYDSMVVSPDKQPRNKFVYARIWHDWLTDKHGLAAITSYKLGGEQIFFPCRAGAAALCQGAQP
jgi:tungstate transport system substrate-binding protein